jgi:hypothetical protein
MDALFCNVELVRPYRTSGRMNFWVTGTIELCSDAGKNNYGWLSGKIETARKEYTKELAFSRDENPIQFEHNNSDFVKNYIYFSYAHSVQFNDIQEKIEAVQWPERN